MALAVFALAITAIALVALGRPDFDAFLDYGLVRIAGEFLVGCLLYQAYEGQLGRTLPWGLLGAAALGGALIFAVLAPIASVVCLAIFVYALANEPKWLGVFFGNRPAIWLGEISYSIYMLHWIVLTRGYPLIKNQISHWPLEAHALLIIVLVIAVAGLTYRFVECPTRRELRGFVA